MPIFFKEERDKDFLKSCESVRMQNKHLSASLIAKMAVYTPAPSFYLTTREIAKIVRKIRKCKVSAYHNSTTELYKEIETRINQVERHECLSAYSLADIIDEQTAPRFYISESRAVALYYESLNKKRKENELRCRNDFFARNFIIN